MGFEVNRRAALCASAALVADWSVAQTALPMPVTPSAQDSSQKPYIELPSPIADDRRWVLTFFLFSCPYCRANHEAISQWITGLPVKWLQHEWVPVVTDAASMTAAVMFYAARKHLSQPRDLHLFMAKAYSMIQDQGIALADNRAWLQLLGRRVDPIEHKAAVFKAIQRLGEYHITNTPSMAIGGRYVITPEIVSGRTDLFMELASGVTSMALSSLGYTGR